MANCSHEGCRAHSLTDGDLCFSHSQKPEIIQKRNAARSKGGRRKAHTAQYIDSIDSIDDLKVVLIDALNELRSCGSDNIIQKARTVGFLVKVGSDLLKDGDLEERIAALEEAQTT